MKAWRREVHNRYQRNYFDHTKRSRLAVGETPYVVQHLARMIDIGRLHPSDTILEIGAGPGKFTLPLLARGYHVTANDLSPVLLDQLKAAAGERVRTICCDVAQIDQHVPGKYDRAIGFFVLHHLIDFDGTFRSLSRILKPGGRISFCEPVAWNPLYYVQILCTPNMKFAGEPSLVAMRPGRVFPAMHRAGFTDARAHRYGYFPPLVKNTRLGDRLEQWLEKESWLPLPHAFQVFTARLPK
jgi:SAM-dependent methyltransferase